MRTSSVNSAADCHGDQPTATTLQQNEPVVALVGSPNSGKTTLFNWLTGSRFKTVNYPGSTVDHSLGRTHERFGPSIAVMDTPGTYSLDPKSPDEMVTMNAIFRHDKFGAANLVISIADATLLSRQLYVTKQLIAAGFDVVLAITMSDLLKERHEELDVENLRKELGVPVVVTDGRLGGGVAELIEVVRTRLQAQAQPDAIANGEPASKAKPQPDAQIILGWSDDNVESTLRETAQISIRSLKAIQHPHIRRQVSTARVRTKKIDRVLLHPVWGLVIFIVMMAGLFSAIFWAAAPVMDGIDKGLTFVADHILALGPENLVLQFISGGVLASASAVLVFVPQIFILFLGIILLEDSGYLARSATLIDKPLATLGLGGRSFVPLLSGYACAVPAMMAARTINSKRERWLTLFIIPLMSCSARLPVYALLLTFLFHDHPAWQAGLVLTAIYVGSLLLGGIAALIASRFLKVDETSFFMLELPVYRAPKVKLVLRQAFSRTRSYILRAGPPIFCFALIIWCATTFPRYDLQDRSARLEGSYAARAGQVIQPLFRPMGGDWRTGVGLLSAFAARETFVSSLALLFQVTDKDEDSLQQTLLNKMQGAKAPDGLPLFTIASVTGLILFFMIALQCLSTVTVALKESGRWKFALTQLAVFNVVAYVIAVAVVQGLRALGIS